MPDSSVVDSRLTGVEGLNIKREAPLREYTRFGLGGPADVLADASTEEALRHALQYVRKEKIPYVVIGGGSNLVCADNGFRGVVIRYTAGSITSDGALVSVDAGAELQDLVDFTIDRGLSGIHTMTGIPGWVGGAVYGNAGAYGRST